jgi:predicted Zn-dependent peptidase
MMLGGVGFQAGLDQSRREHVEAERRQALVDQLENLRDSGTLTPEEFDMAKRKLLDG